MVRVQDEQQRQRLVEHRRGLVGLGRHREHHVQEVLGVGQVVARVDEGLADRLLVREGGDRRRLGEQADDVEVLLLLAAALRVVGRQRGDHRRQHRHRVRGRREAVEQLLHVLVQQRVAGELVLEALELGGRRQLAVDQQVADLGEGGVLGDLVDRVAAVAQDPLLAVDKGDRARAGARVAVRRVVGDGAGGAAQRGDVDSDLVLGADEDRELVLLALQQQLGLFHLASPLVDAGPAPEVGARSRGRAGAGSGIRSESPADTLDRHPGGVHTPRGGPAPPGARGLPRRERLDGQRPRRAEYARIPELPKPSGRIVPCSADFRAAAGSSLLPSVS